MTEKLILWTGERWIISLSKNSEAKSLYEKTIEQRSLKLNQIQKSEIAKEVTNAFPDAIIEKVTEDNNE